MQSLHFLLLVPNLTVTCEIRVHPWVGESLSWVINRSGVNKQHVSILKVEIEDPPSVPQRIKNQSPITDIHLSRQTAKQGSLQVRLQFPLFSLLDI